MDYVYIKNLVEEKYSINVQSVEKIKNVYKIIDNIGNSYKGMAFLTKLW